MSFWTKKSLAELIALSEDNSAHSLRRELSTADILFLGIGAIIGAGLFSITGVAAALHAGPAIVLSFVIAAIGCGFAALCYSELAAMIPVSGSVYTYAYAVMGEFVAWMIGWDLVLEYSIGAVAVAISWSAYVVSFLNDFGVELPDWMIASPWQPTYRVDGSRVYGVINLPAVAIVVVLSLLLIRGIKQTVFINSAIVTIKVAIILLFIALGIAYINLANYSPFIPENTGKFGEFGISGILQGAAIVFFAYIGFDAVSTTVRETKRPERSVPIGILGSLVICTLLYMLFAFVLTGLVPYSALDVAAPVALAVDRLPYHWLHSCIKFAIIAGLTSVILVMLLGQSRILYVMAKDGFLPPLCCTVHSKFRTPWLTHLLLMVFVGICSGFTPLAIIGEMTSIGTLLAFVIVCISTWLLRRRHPEYPRPFRTPCLTPIAISGSVVCLGMMYALEWETWLRFLIWLVIGLAVYFFYSRYRVIKAPVKFLKS